METVIYTVKQGDTLCDIAKKYNTTVNMIARFNGIIDTGLLEPDRVLRIPVTLVPETNPYYEYTVQHGDTLFSLAEKFNTTVEALAKLNAIENPDEIWAGNILKIPVFAVTLPMKKPESDEDDGTWHSGSIIASQIEYARNAGAGGCGRCRAASDQTDAGGCLRTAREYGFPAVFGSGDCPS